MAHLRRVRIFASILTAISGSIATSGCSFFVPFTQPVTVTASEPDAQIFINGSFVGTGMGQMRVRRNSDVAVLVTKQGYRPASRTIDHSLGAAGIVDIIGGCIWLIPFLGLLSPGAWTLDQTNVVVLLGPEQPPQP